MNKTLGKLLRDLRKEEANLKQEDLGRMINMDASMISRFETGKRPLTPSTLQAIINALALEGVPREKLDHLWEAAGYHRSHILDVPVAHPMVSLLHQEFGRLEPDEKAVLAQDVRSVVEMDQAYFSAKKHMRKRSWKSARDALVSLKRHLEQRLQYWYLRIDEELGVCSYAEGNYEWAVDSFESALLTARQLGDRHTQAEILMKLGDAHRRRGGADWKTAHDRYGEAKRIFEDLGERIRVADCLRKIAGVFLFEGRPDEALPRCQESLTISQGEAYDWGRYKALQHQAWACDMLGQWSEATRLYEEALTIVQGVAVDEWELAKAFRYLGDAYRLERRIDDAEEAYREALDILQRSEAAGYEVRLLSGMIYLGLGQVYLKQPGKELEGGSWLNQSLEVHVGLGEDFRIAQVWIEQGALLLRMGRVGEAEKRLRRASDRLGRWGNIFFYANALAGLCEVYYENEELGSVYEVAQAARSVDNGLIDYFLARIELIVGRAHFDQGKHAMAIDAVCKASEKALQFNAQSFRELNRNILDEADRVAHVIAPEVALQLCELYERFWQSRSQKLGPTKQKVVEEALEAIRQKKEETGMLVAITDDKDANHATFAQ